MNLILFSTLVWKLEPSFVDHFLIVFRRFSTPFDVLSALINRFEFVSYHLEDDPLLTRYAQMKLSLGVDKTLN